MAFKLCCCFCLLGDREAESRVQDHLFIPFRQILSWSSPTDKLPSEDVESTEPLKSGVGNHSNGVSNHEVRPTLLALIARSLVVSYTALL